MYRKELLGDSEEDVIRYISSCKEDRKFVNEIIEVLILHTRSLAELGLIPREADKRITATLKELLHNPEILFEIDAEDIHEAIEIYLEKRIGELEDYLPLGRSRNDHVNAALRLKITRHLRDILSEIISMRRTLLKKCQMYLDTLIPTFTHLQPAQASTFSFYLCYIDETLDTYGEAIKLAIRICEKSPLGCGASASTGVPFDRRNMGKSLFSGYVRNCLVATGSRDFLSLSAGIVTSLAVALSRIAEDMIIFSTPQFGYILPPMKHLATSSMMPHKKNPVSMEIARAMGGKSIGNLVAILSVIKGVPSGYNLDLQEANSHAITLLERVLDTLHIMKDFFETMEISKENTMKDCLRFPILSTEVAELLSMKESIPYRKAHRLVAKLVRESKTMEDFRRSLREMYGMEISVRESIQRAPQGSPDPKRVKEYIAWAEKRIEEFETWHGGDTYECQRLSPA